MTHQYCGEHLASKIQISKEQESCANTLFTMCDAQASPSLNPLILTQPSSPLQSHHLLWHEVRNKMSILPRSPSQSLKPWWCFTSHCLGELNEVQALFQQCSRLDKTTHQMVKQVEILIAPSAKGLCWSCRRGLASINKTLSSVTCVAKPEVKFCKNVFNVDSVQQGLTDELNLNNEAGKRG